MPHIYKTACTHINVYFIYFQSFSTNTFLHYLSCFYNSLHFCLKKLLKALDLSLHVSLHAKQRIQDIFSHCKQYFLTLYIQKITILEKSAESRIKSDPFSWSACKVQLQWPPHTPHYYNYKSPFVLYHFMTRAWLQRIPALWRTCFQMSQHKWEILIQSRVSLIRQASISTAVTHPLCLFYFWLHWSSSSGCQ